MIRGSLLEAGRADLADTAELLVSEVVTNALVHAGTTIEVAFAFVGRGLRVEVTDGSPHAPSPRGYGPNAGTGRGLMLLEEMVDDWGVVPGERGKTVWFQIAEDGAESTQDTGARGQERPARRPAGTNESFQVELIDVPLLIHEAWRQHAESLLREHLLASLDDDRPDQGARDPILVHSEASDAIALLAEHIPRSGVSDRADEVMVSATEPRVTGPRVSLPVPHESLPHFATLDRTMRSALAMVEEGRFLTPRTQPEVQAFRSWVCNEVSRQGNGAAPVPWTAEDTALSLSGPSAGWDVRHVAEAGTGMLAADDDDRIIAVSGPALDTLGYSAAEDLVGARLISIIPTRYRQAHLAGFTMFFLTGRAPLLDRTVTVPALRQDGTEVEISLTIHQHRAENGRTFFVADIADSSP